MKFKTFLLIALIILLMCKLPIFAKKQAKQKLSLKVDGAIHFFTDFYEYNETKNYGSTLRNIILGVHGNLYKKITFMIRVKGDYGFGTGSLVLRPSRTWFDIRFSPFFHIRVGKDYAPTSRFALYDSYHFNIISAHRAGHYTYIGPVTYLYTIYAFGTIYPDQGLYIWGKYSLTKNFHIKYYSSFLNGFYSAKEPFSKKGRFVARLQLNFGRAEPGYFQRGFYFGKNTFSLGYSYDRDLNFYDTDKDKIVDNPSENHTFDIFIERVLGPIVINLESSYVIWNDLTEKLLLDYTAKLGRISFYISKIKLQPWFSYEDYIFDRDYTYSIRVLKFGFNYYLQKELSFRGGFALYKRAIRKNVLDYHNFFLGIFLRF
ncbi:OprO/OprP family phosphate-selective porin [SCandidatus Aminicenantes bacterium Aminicenantia_JdfR_composite]|jgi:hypothetical protein|nr:OprO/OprP family phosphate-selective porin [SCandidatus Aminicenantes bacterium Aminicenantia_JdfR_composite]MCP2597705.1 OprO/OprP family phosphate-selective porin [Candidatus Aminicenantes bacterium AC-335-G13]